MSNIHELESYRDSKAILAQLEGRVGALKHGGGDGTSGGMDAVDAKIAAAEARTDTKFAELRGDLAFQFGEIKTELARKPGTGVAVGIAIALFAAIVAAIAFGGDRFDAGVGMADVRQQQLQRDQNQDEAVQRIENKIDKLIESQATNSAR